MKNKLLIIAGIIVIILSAVFAFYFCIHNTTAEKLPVHSLSDRDIQKSLGKELNEAIFVLDKYFEKYNEKNFPYICKNLIADDFFKEQNRKECNINIKTAYDIYGREQYYNLEDAYILKTKNKNRLTYYLEIPTNFQNQNDVLFNIKLIKEKTDIFKIHYINIESN